MCWSFNWCRITVALVAVVVGSAVAEAADRHALLIGINEYAVNDRPPRPGLPRFPDLRGAINDVDLLVEVLQERFAFPASNLHVLKDKQATRQAILDAIDALAERTRPGDVVYVHFSGHGSQVEDRGGDEADGKDETLLSYDARTDGVADITDDELGRAFARLGDRHLWVALDSCHSGTATRDTSDLLTRRVPPDRRLELYDELEPTRTRGRREVASDGGDRLGYVLLTGAAEQQSALDGPIRGRYYGFFSYLFARSLETAPEGVSAQEVHADVLDGFDRLGRRLRQISMPKPQLEGAPVYRDRALFEVLPATGGESARERPADGSGRPSFNRARPQVGSSAGRPGTSGDATTVAVASTLPPRLRSAGVRDLGDGQILLVRADAFDGEPGSVWSIYPEGERSFAPGGAIAVARATRFRADGALEAVLLPPVTRLPGSKGRAVLLASAATREIRIGWESVDPVLRATLTAMIENHGTRIIAERGGGSSAAFVVRQEGARVEVLGLGGLHTMAQVPADDMTELRRAADLIGRTQSVADMLSLENRSSALELQVQVQPAEAGHPRTNRPAGAHAVPSYRLRRPDEPRSKANSLQVELQPSADGFVTVVGVDTAGRIVQLFPNALSEARGFRPFGRVEAGETVLLPDTLGPINRAGFYWDIAPPVGVDTLQVFLTTDEATTRQIRDYVAGLRSTSSSGRPVGAPASDSAPGRPAAGASAASAGGSHVAGARPASLPGARATATRGAAGSTTATGPTDLVAAIAQRGIRLVAVEGPRPIDPLPPTSGGAAPAPGDWTSRSVTYLIERE